MPVDELNFDIGWNARDFKRGLDAARKEIDRFIRQTLGKRAGIVQSIPSILGSAGVMGAEKIAGLGGINRGPIASFFAQRAYRYSTAGARQSVLMGSAAAKLAGAASLTVPLMAGRRIYEAAERRAQFVRDQRDTAFRTRRPVGTLNYGSVTRQDVTDVDLQDERIQRTKAKIDRLRSPFLQNFRGAISQFEQDVGDLAEGRNRPRDFFQRALMGGPAGFGIQAAFAANRGYNQMLQSQFGQLPIPSRREQRRMDEQLDAKWDRVRAITESNRSQISWEIR